jgi:hypothetical protein
MTWKYVNPAAAVAAGALALAGCGNNGGNAPAANAPAPAPANTAAAPAAAPFTPVAPAAPTTVHFVNQMRPGADPSLMGHIADFSFDYPSDMTVVANPKTWVQLVQVDATNRPLAIFVALPIPNDPPEMLQSDMTQLASQLTAGMPGFQEVDRSATTFGGWPAVQMRFSAAPTKPDGERIVVYGRLILVPGFAGTNSVGVYMMSLGAPEVHSVDDISAKGDLATIATSFKMGK